MKQTNVHLDNSCAHIQLLTNNIIQDLAHIQHKRLLKQYAILYCIKDKKRSEKTRIYRDLGILSETGKESQIECLK